MRKILGYSLSFLLAAVIIVACMKIPETGKSKLLLTSNSYEQKLGEDGYREVLAKSKINRDPRLNKILQRVGKRIAKAANHPEYDWQFTLIESKEQNAWCMPGGKVAFYTGILPALQTEGGMAVVMGHEVAHATLRHSGQRISQQMLINLGLSAADVSLSNSKYHDTLIGLMGAGLTVGVVLPYGRGHESEADVIGLKYMARAGYDPHEAVKFWQRFGRTGGAAPPEFLSTHPGAANRVKKLQQYMPEAIQLYQAARQKFGVGESL